MCQKELFTEEPRFNEPLHNEILGISSPSNSEYYMKINFDIPKPCYSELYFVRP